MAAVVDEKILCMHGGLSPEITSMEQIKRIVRPTDVPDTGLLCDLLWADPEKDITGRTGNITARRVYLYSSCALRRRSTASVCSSSTQLEQS